MPNDGFDAQRVAMLGKEALAVAPGLEPWQVAAAGGGLFLGPRTAGLPLPAKGLTNMVHVSVVGEGWGT